MKYLDAFNLKGGDEMSMKQKIKEHIIWKNDKIWKKLFEVELEKIITLNTSQEESLKEDESEVKPTEQSNSEIGADANT